MRVTDRTATPQVSGTSGPSRGGASSSKFSLDASQGAERTGSTQAAAPMRAMDGLLALQASGDSLERRKRAMRRGKNLLDTLDQLKIAILSGRVSAQQLDILKGQLQQRPDAIDDPGLADVLAHIEMRAQVEIAKLARG